MLEELEAEHVLVPAHPVVHLAELDVADAVVDVHEPAGVLAVVVVEGEALHRREAGRERAALLELVERIVARPAHEAVPHAAIGLDAGEDDRAALVRSLDRFVGGLGTVAYGLLVGCGRVLDGERDVLDAVPVPGHLGVGRVAREQAG